MGTAVKLYYTYSTALGVKWELIPSKLLVVEDIESYLATKTAKTISDFQYIKNELEISINVDLSQDYSQPRSETNFKYVSIQNASEQIHYYFVKKATWRSKTCVRFDLVMDVLNTFQEGRDFNFKANTRIVREHKDRFVKKLKDRYFTITIENYIESGSLNVDDVVVLEDGDNNPILEDCIIKEISSDESYYYITLIVSSLDTRDDEVIIDLVDSYSGLQVAVSKTGVYVYGTLVGTSGNMEHTYEYFRQIDIVDEGINPILQCGNAEGKYIQSNVNLLKQDWYLLYRNQNDPDDSLTNPVNCYLIPENDTDTDSAYIESGRLIPSWVENGKYYYFSLPNGMTYTLSNGVSITGDGGFTSYVLAITKCNNKLVVICYSYNTSAMAVIWQYDDIDYITITPLPAHYNVKSSSDLVNVSFLESLTFPNNFNNSGDLTSADNINILDRGDPKNIKLIKLPYVPYNFSLPVSEDYLEIVSDSNWELTSFSQQVGGDMIALKLRNDMSIKLHSEHLETTNQPLPNLYISSLNPSISDLRLGQNYESKLFHSSFYQPTYAYDSFTYKIQLEKININSYTSADTNTLKIRFDMTSTINSKFMFSFPDLKLKNATENYAKYMPIARNNEEVLYNVPYINYIRTGFNYDVKSKERTNASNLAGLGLSLLSTGASLLLPSAPLKVAGVVAGLVSMAMSIKNTIVSAQQNDDSIRRKLQEAQNQASSVAGSDDVDLMSVYAQNRLKYLVYEPTALMKSILYDLFFYAGYSSGRMGLPSHNTRVNFDYLECEASLENEGSIPDDCLQELLNCLKTGITYLHKTNRVSNTWDFEQVYENWETSLMED